tara:strand:+ start:4206 stop:5387 length:1182 start_codon:yes stop_codon:yes gene_type:complete
MGMKNQTTSKLQNEDGFTLIDISIMLLVVGILATPFLMEYNTFLKQEQREQTGINIDESISSIGSFYHAQDRYPCPADPTLRPGDANYGIENCGAAGNVLYGAVPFRTLGIEERESLDAFKNKLLYGVTRLQTIVGNDYSKDSGSITVARLRGKNPARNMACSDQATLMAENPSIDLEHVVNTGVHFIVLSHGRSGTGAFNVAGNQVLACPALGNTADAENCNFGADDNFIMHECMHNETEGANFFDDIVLGEGEPEVEKTSSPPSDDMWSRNNTNGSLNNTAGNIGIGTGDPQHQLDVVGSIKASSDYSDPTKNAAALANRFCDSTGSYCFDPNSISGYDPNLNCTDGLPAGGIGSNKAKCQKATTLGSTKCGSNQFVIGFNPDGSVRCGSL